MRENEKTPPQMNDQAKQSQSSADPWRDLTEQELAEVDEYMETIANERKPNRVAEEINCRLRQADWDETCFLAMKMNTLFGPPALLPTESSAAFTTLLAELTSDLNPKYTLELSHIRRLADIEVEIARFDRAIAGLIDGAVGKQRELKAQQEGAKAPKKDAQGERSQAFVASSDIAELKSRVRVIPLTAKTSSRLTPPPSAAEIDEVLPSLGQEYERWHMMACRSRRMAQSVLRQLMAIRQDNKLLFFYTSERLHAEYRAFRREVARREAAAAAQPKSVQ